MATDPSPVKCHPGTAGNPTLQGANPKIPNPSKRTALAFAVALELRPEDANNLLGTAGYQISKSQMSDLIVEKFIECNQFDISKINEALFRYNLKPLGR